jgi:hypothetical protein
MRVRFNYVREFLEELTQDAALVEDGILRLTQHYQPVPMKPLATLSLRAGVIIRNKLVELHQPIGQISRLTHNGMENAKVQHVAKYFRDRVETKARALGLTVRQGMFEP